MDRIVEAVKSEQDGNVDAVVAVDEQPHRQSSMTDDDITQRIANMPRGQRDLLVGRHMRAMGGEWLSQYGEFLRAAARATPMEVKGRLVYPHNADRYVSFKCRQRY